MRALSGRTERLALLTQADFDVSRLASGIVDFDLSTDSWGQLDMPIIHARMADLRERAQTCPVDLTEALSRIFPFRHFIPTRRGRDAEDLLFTALEQKGGRAIQNILFHTARERQQQNNLVPLEIPVGNAFTAEPELFKGDVDLAKLKWALAGSEVSIIFIEALSNGIGGHPISMANLRAVHALAQDYDVPVYLDATRAVENCLLIQTRESELTGRLLAVIMDEFFSYVDGITASLVKDFGITYGGLLATRSDKIFSAAQASDLYSKIKLSNGEQDCLGQAISEWDVVATGVQTRMNQVQTLGQNLKNRGFPVHTPIGGHCVILDLAELTKAQEKGLPLVKPYLAWLYEYIGVRAALHWNGLVPEYQRPLWIRLTVPLGFPERDMDVLLQRIAALNL